MTNQEHPIPQAELPAEGVDAGDLSATGDAPPGPEATAAPAPDYDTLLRERDEYLDLLRRKTAEFDNYRKRQERERRELSDLAAADVIQDLLPLVDNLDRALKTGTADATVDAYRRGVELIQKQLLDLLARRGVTPIDPLGETFDPHWHDAVVREATSGGRDGEVTEVFSRGYRLGDRLLRPAMVKVATS
jgi:molecular chaperone GrpE